MTKPESIGIFCKNKPKSNLQVLRELIKKIRGRGFEVLLDKESSNWIGEKSDLDKKEMLSKANMIVVLGGDGTLLGVARLAHPYDIPILAVNLGSLGFITEISLQEFDEAFEKAVTGKLKIEKRMLLNSNLRCEGKATNDHNALNEVVVQKGSGLKIVGLEVYVDNTYMTSYRADGLIIGSPTGSTAYSLSAGGPIIHPSMDALVLSPICPFALTNRPIVVPDRSEIQVRLTSESQKARVTLDGQEEYEMTRNETLTVKKGNNHILLFQSPNKSFYQILREKLQWGGKRDNQN